MIYKIIITSCVICFIACNKEQVSLNHELSIIEIHDLNISEPSGLTLKDSETFICVSDSDGKAYEINKKGDTIEQYDFQASDLEGIAFCTLSNTIYYVDEQKGKLFQRNLDNQLINQWQIIDGSSSGLEGCSLDEKNQVIYMLKEKEPGLLICFNLITEKLITHELHFADDYSGIFYSASEQELWIASDKSRTISKCDLNGNLIDQFNVGFKKAEGLVVDVNLGIIYAVSDSEEKLYSLLIP